MGADVIDAEALAARYEDEENLTPAERAAADRTWAFGHVIVDEAQELSQMAWRMVMRRIPVKSMTIVGDVAQTGDLAGLPSWGHALGAYVGDRWRLAGLTINYRTPAEVMEVAADVLAGHRPGPGRAPLRARGRGGPVAAADQRGRPGRGRGQGRRDAVRADRRRQAGRDRAARPARPARPGRDHRAARGRRRRRSRPDQPRRRADRPAGQGPGVRLRAHRRARPRCSTPRPAASTTCTSR